MRKIKTLSLLLLLSCPLFSQIIFEYDKAGNLILREYRLDKLGLHELVQQEKIPQQLTYVYPNPVDTELSIVWDFSISDLITSIELTPYNGTNIEKVNFSASLGKAVVNMTFRPPGVYYLKIYLSDGKVFNYSLIKN